MPKRIDLPVDEMLKMRENGMTNRDIANAFGVHVQTVKKRIGPEGRYRRGVRYINIVPQKKEEPEEQYSASLVVQNKSIELDGTYGRYVVDFREKKVIASIAKTEEAEEMFSVEFEKIETLINELQAIRRNIRDKGGIGSEMW